MSLQQLQQLIEELRPAQNVGWNHGVMQDIKDILSSNPQLLKELDSEAGSKLLLTVLFENFIYDKEIIKLFLKREANINLLQDALLQGDIESAETLLKNGEKPEGTVWYMFSLINCIFWRGNLFICKELLILLVKYGFDTGFHNSEGENLLHIFYEYFASKYDYYDALEITEILIKSGVSTTEVDNEGWTPFVRAMKTEDNVPLVSFLIDKGALTNFNYELVQIDEQYPIISAIFDKDIVDLLLSNGIDVNFKTDTGWTALHEACIWNNEESISFLLQKGADVNAENESGETPFFVLDVDNYDASVSITIIKELSKRTYENLPISTINMDIIQESLKAQKHFELCSEELKKMSNTIFHHPYSYYFVFRTTNKDIQKLAKLTKNKEFISNFEEKLHKFAYYKTDLERIFEEAIQVRNELLVVDSRLKTAFGDFLPDVVLRKLAKNLTPKDLPLV